MPKGNEKECVVIWLFGVEQLDRFKVLSIQSALVQSSR